MRQQRGGSRQQGGKREQEAAGAAGAAGASEKQQAEGDRTWAGQGNGVRGQRGEAGDRAKRGGQTAGAQQRGRGQQGQKGRAAAAADAGVVCVCGGELTRLPESYRPILRFHTGACSEAPAQNSVNIFGVIRFVEFDYVYCY